MILAIVVLHHFNITDPTIPWVAKVFVCLGFLAGIAQDINEFRR